MHGFRLKMRAARTSEWTNNIYSLMFKVYRFIFTKLIVELPSYVVVSGNDNKLKSYEGPERCRMSISWEAVNAFVEFQSAFFQRRRDPPKQIIFDAIGAVDPGEFLAIIGSSGSGKTSLLNAINYRMTRNTKMSGIVKINGVQVRQEELGDVCAYVSQEDLFIGTLTVYEHLKFLALLKLSADYSYFDKLKRVDDLIIEFNLTKCKDNVIGFAGKRGISGGERKRLALASEILPDHQIICCDEPTSGLDNQTAAMIIDILHGLATKGKTVISSIHQPPSQFYEKFDLLCILSDGKTAYFGRRESAMDFFLKLNYTCPSMFNPADFFIEIFASDLSDNKYEMKKQAIFHAFEKSDDRKKICEKIQNTVLRVPSRLSKREPFVVQLKHLMWRQKQSNSRDVFFTWMLLSQSILIGVFLGITFHQSEVNQESIQDKAGLLFTFLLQTCIANLFGYAYQHHNQWRATELEVRNKVYSGLVYYVAKVFSELPQNIIFPLITVTLTYCLSNTHSSIHVYLVMASTVVLTANAAVGFATFLSIITPNFESSIALIGATFLPILTFSGFLLSINTIPRYFTWIQRTSWLFYANEALLITLWSNTAELKCSEVDTEIVFGNSTFHYSKCIKTGQKVLESLNIDSNNMSHDIQTLVLMVFFWRTIAGVSLTIKSRF